MSIEATIQNVGEYFSAHYMSDNKGLTKDISEHVKYWKEQGSQSIPRQLQSLSEDFFSAKSKALDYPEPELRDKTKEKYLNNWHPKLLSALGYQAEPINIELESENKQIPAVLRLNRHGQSWLAIFQAPFCLNSGDLVEEVLEVYVEPSHNSGTSPTIEGLPTLITQWEHAIALLFKQEDRPRWAMLLAGSRIYLFDAHTYSQGRYLYIDLDAAYSSKDNKTFEAIAALLAKECLAPKTESDEVLHEKLREGSIKSTHGVSEQLQGAVREAIELIANGWIAARRKSGKGFRKLSEQEGPIPNGTPNESYDVTAEQLKHDALVYVYRTLFCLYAEARGGELGVLPITDDVYRLGYSMEALRDLADKGEPGTQTEEGSYFAEHLNRLFQLVYEGFHPEGAENIRLEESDEKKISHASQQIDLFAAPQEELDLNLSVKKKNKKLDRRNAKTFIIQPLTATLFAPKATPLLSRVLLSNKVLYQVVRRLSLGTGKKGKQIDRINYAELGIVQLGSVYEGLLSYKGFFAKEDLIQVIQAGKAKKIKGKNQVPIVYDDNVDSKKPSWFVPKSREEEFKQGEVVIENRSNQARIYKAGEFILHLNGVDRVNSASYYTPEVLTKALVKEALNERLKDFGAENADKILTLKICEPAMGSAAFLVEAIDQLARHYLLLKQEQINQFIDPTTFEEELGRVKHYIAVQNVYGVDLNPTAVELGALSLWLASIHRLKIQTGENGSPDIYRPGQTPWFGLRLRAGNSLIGARRAVWSYDQLATGKHYGKNAQAPRQLKPGEQRKENEIYHFLVWDEDMVPAARDKLMKSYWPEECEIINIWQKEQVKQKWKPEELAKAKIICNQIDKLWEDYAKHRIIALEKTQCAATVWPLSSASEQAMKLGPTLEFQENSKIDLELQSGAFQRLKLLMDSWCSFYFWPLQETDHLPTRYDWLETVKLLSNWTSDEIIFALEYKEISDFTERMPCFKIAKNVNNNQNFHHWELIFTEILGCKLKEQKIEPKGFDLMFGNPPWMKITWRDTSLLSEYEPLLGVRDSKSAKYNKERPKLLENEEHKLNYKNNFTIEEGVRVFLNDRTLYPALAGVQTNLYKNFIEHSWGLLKGDGIVGLLHPEGIFDDPNGGDFRYQYYQRLRSHFQLKNELILFADVDHHMAFSINIYQGDPDVINFKAIFNLFSPATIEQCYQKRQSNLVIPGIKTNSGQWETLGHYQRLINITEKELSLFAKLFENSELKTSKARLPQVHSLTLLSVIKKLSQVSKRLGDLKEQYFVTEMFHEANAQKKGIITREESPSFQPKSTDEWIISGPHYYVSNPFNKTPRSSCTANGHYDSVNPMYLSEYFLPRAVYRPGDKNGNLDEFFNAIPEWPKPQKPFKDDNGQWNAGFWAIAAHEIIAYEIILGEKINLYGIDKTYPGAKTSRQFGYFDRWEGDIEVAIIFLLNNNHRNKFELIEKFPGIILHQAIPRKPLNLLPKPYTSYYKYFNRSMAQSANERSLIPVIMPRGCSHIGTSFSMVFLSEKYLVEFSAAASSICYDFIQKISGKPKCTGDIINKLPFPEGYIAEELGIRFLQLIALTKDYDSLKNNYKNLLTKELYKYSTDVNIKITNELSRRLCQIEIDVLTAILLNLEINELIDIYTIQFPILKFYEEADRYDSKGAKLPNTTRKDAGAKELREALKNHDNTSPLTVSWQIDNDNQTITKTFYPPFKHVDRIEDYKTAYRVFSERLELSN
jgi:hypothetical protein